MFKERDGTRFQGAVCNVEGPLRLTFLLFSFHIGL